MLLEEEKQMETEVAEKLVHAVAQYAEKMLGGEGFRYVSIVVANCKMLALQRETQHEEDDTSVVDMDALIIAAYLHDISTASQGFQQHHLASAQMAVEFLQTHHAPPELITNVEQAILTHMTSRNAESATPLSLEGRILYDADKLGRLSGLAVVTSLIEFGAHYTNRAVTGDMLAAMLRNIEERFIDLYQSLNTEPARDMAREKFSSTLAFLDGVIEHLSDATPI